MNLKNTKLLLTTAAVAVVLPTSLALSQQGQQGGAGGAGAGTGGQTQRQQQQQHQQQHQQVSPEQAKQMAEKWFKHAASGNQFEVEAGRLAQERLQDEHLKQAAQTVMQDHQQANELLRQQAQKAGVEISETPELMPVHRAKLDELREKQGQEFDRHWVFAQVAGHTHDILEYTWASEKGPSPEIQEYARQTLPKLQQHAQHIAPVAYQLAGIQSARTAGGRIEGQGQGQGQQPGQGGTGGSGGAGGGGSRSGGGAGGTGGGAGGAGGGTGGTGGGL